MLLTVGELRERVTEDMPSLVEDLSRLTGRGGEQERRAWRRSLPRLSEALTTAELDAIHVHFSRRDHHVALEYQLPGASSWCDVVLLGRHGDRPTAIIIELKDWETNADRPGIAEGLIERHGLQELHPSDQLRGYVEYCRRFHSTVLHSEARVDGFVLFTTGLMKRPYEIAPNHQLVKDFPIFSMAANDIRVDLPGFLRTRLTESDSTFAEGFARGTFLQDRSFLQQIGRTILDGSEKHFELLDNQRRAFNLCLAIAKARLAAGGESRKVIVVEGPPGSGKSAVAARLWANLVTDEDTPDGNVVLVTTSQSQSSNWTYFVDRVANQRAGRGVARKATSFSPLTIPQLSRLRSESGLPNLYRRAEDWRLHLKDLAQRGVRGNAGAEDLSCVVSLVDEAHALINPERPHGVGQYGFVTGLGPQAFHIIRCSRLTVFFLDPDQSFRSRENTTIEDIETWAKDLGATVERVSLQGVQFRCAGSSEYVAWVESLLRGALPALNRVYASAWYEDPALHRGHAAAVPGSNVVVLRARRQEPVAGLLEAREATAGHVLQGSRLSSIGMDLQVFIDPFSMEKALRQHIGNYTVRLVSTYSRRWLTGGSTYPHNLPAEQMDFREIVQLADGKRRIWSRIWNFVPGGNDYTAFVAGRAGTPIHDDPLCEVGCPYAVRGFDFDYLGLLWLDDFLWRDGKWVVNLQNVHESGIRTLVNQARHEGPVAPVGPRGTEVVEKVRQAYRILLTRAIRGVYLWVPDAETREHVSSSLRVDKLSP